jgi:hypothetical protein
MINKNLNNVDAALMAGGSRPMHQVTGMPLQGNAPSMGNFGGAMASSNIPMYDQSMSLGQIAMSRKEKMQNIKNIGAPAEMQNIKNIGAPAEVEANMIANIEQYRSCKKK